MLVDCDQCTVRGTACASCAMTFVTESGPAPIPAISRVAGSAPAPASRAGLGSASRPATAPRPPGKSRGKSAAGNRRTGGAPSPAIELDPAEMRALAALANAGMIPPLRYAPSMLKAS